MKQVLLRVTAVFAKIGFGKFTQPLRGYFFRPREVFLSQDALDPNIDGKRAQAFVGEEHHTISNLHANARQPAQPCPQIDIG